MKLRNREFFSIYRRYSIAKRGRLHWTFYFLDTSIGDLNFANGKLEVTPRKPCEITVLYDDTMTQNAWQPMSDSLVLSGWCRKRVKSSAYSRLHEEPLVGKGLSLEIANLIGGRRHWQSGEVFELRRVRHAGGENYFGIPFLKTT